jgi:hypothetical protein
MYQESGTTIRDTMLPFCLTPMATISKRSVPSVVITTLERYQVKRLSINLHVKLDSGVGTPSCSA